ncbi:MAG: Gfo/Idh/MocA family oxidoreductase, partial [Terrimicrobiaceae bacterium]|nr:Gfo/Idh/MocA family oxidoreductase [Terrimicrobiaceae bacterium]
CIRDRLQDHRNLDAGHLRHADVQQREFGLVFALENHPEASPEELLGKLGEGDEDILRVAADTGWFGTQGFPADEALRRLLPRLAVVHLKDVRAAGGHETCRHGQGVVPVGQCLEVLRQGGYKGPISIEHEPFGADPLRDCEVMRREVAAVLGRRPSTNRRRVRVGIAGCGNIGESYGRQLSSYPEIALHAVTDLDPSRARAFERQFGPRAYPSLDGLLADSDVELIVNLTIHSAHYEVIRSCIEAGRHVYTEKPLALEAAPAHELAGLAARHGVRLGSAPSTWLGEAQQTAWRLIREGRLGTPRVAYAEVNWGRIEAWHPNPAPFYAVGPVFDVAVYPITLLTAWFGPVREVVAGGGILFPHRTTKESKPFTVASEDWTAAVLTLASGLKARITSSFYVGGPDAARGLEVHGDEGSLFLDRWDFFDARVRLASGGGPARPVPLDVPSAGGIEFARGVRDLARALLNDRPHRCTGAHAAHVVEVCEAILQSARSGQKVSLDSDFPTPEFPEPL